VWPDRGTIGAAFAHLPTWLLLIAALLAGPEGFAARPGPAGTSPEAEPWSRERKATALNLGIVGGVVAYGALMWDWGEDTRFRTMDEGWFGADTRHGGADKLGHAYTGAVATAIGAALYRRWGYAEAEAARLGALSGLLLTTAVEVGDGFSPDHRYSWEDQLSNMAGVGIEYLRLRHPWLRERMHFRWEYFPSPAVRRGGHYDITTDYSGSRWMLAFPLRAWGTRNTALKWLELQVGYGTRGYAGRDEKYFDEATRHPYVGVGIHVPLVLEAFGVRGGVRRIFEYIQIPGTALPLPPRAR
jgi:hypothetical protein